MSGKAMRRLWLTVGTLVGLLLAAFACGLFLLNTETGSSWLVDRVRGQLPAGMKIDSLAGTVTGPFELFGVEYVAGPLYVRVERAEVHWRPWELFGKHVQLDSLKVTGALVRWDTTASAPVQEEPAPPPVSNAPWRVTWGQCVASGVVFEGPYAIGMREARLTSSGDLDSFLVSLQAVATYDTLQQFNADLAAHGNLKHLSVDEVVLVRDSTRLSATGEVSWEPERTWNVVADLVHLNPADWSLELSRLAGDVHVAGRCTGEYENELAHFALAVDTLSGHMAGEPVSGQASLNYSEGSVRADSTFIHWGGLQARVQGVVADTVQLSWEAEIPDFSVWHSEYGGRLQAQGEASGPRNALEISANLTGAGLRFREHTSDTLSAELEVHAGATLPSRFRLSAQQAELWGQHFDAIELAAAGTRDDHTLSVHATGTRGHGSAALHGGYDTLWQGALDTLVAAMDSLGTWQLVEPATLLAGADTLSVSRLCLAGESGRFCVDGDADSAGAWRLSARLQSVATDWLCRLLSKDLAFDSRLSGDVQAQAVTAESLVVNAQVAAQPGRLRLAALPADTITTDSIQLDLTWAPSGGQLAADGSFELRGERSPFKVTGKLPGTHTTLAQLSADSIDWRVLEWSGTVDARPLSLAWLDATLPEGTHLEGQASLHLSAVSSPGGILLADCQVELPPGRVEVWTGTDTLLLNWESSLFSLRADSTGLAAQAHSALSTHGQSVGTLDLDLRSDRAFVVGKDPLELPLAGTMSAQIDLAPLQAFVTGVTELSGSFQVGARMSGTLGDLAVDGNLELTAEAFLTDLGIQLSQIRLSMNAAGGQTQVTGSAQSGGGTLEVSGVMSRLPSRESPSRLRVQGKDFLAADTRQAKVWLTPDLELAMFGDSLDLSGRVDVPKANIEVVSLPEQAVPRSPDEVIVGDTLAHHGPSSPFWSRVTLALGDDVFFKGFDVTAFLKGSLDTRQKPGSDPEARGEVVLREGRYRGMGQDLQIDPGRLVFSGPLMDPTIDVIAYRRATDHTKAGFKVTGRLADPQVDLYSDPMKSDNDIMSYILFGRSSGEGSDTERMKAGEAAALVGGNLLAASAATEIGLDEARIDPGYTGNDAALVAGKYISPQLFVGYGQGLFETLHTIRVRYIVSTHISLEAETGTRETADVIYQIERGQ